MEKKSAHDLFVLGEHIAAKSMTAKNYQILQTNFRSPYGEIDLIAANEDTLVFVEVKTRRNHSIASVLRSISPKKQLKISQTAQYYINQGSYPVKQNTRFDVIFVFYDENLDTFKTEHWEDAFIPNLSS